MRALQSVVSRAIRRHYASRDIHVGRQGMFGIDAIADMQRLALRWNLDIRTVFDVGANDGDTAHEVLTCWPRANVLSFEPHPKTFAALNRRLGPQPRFRSFNVALSDRAGEFEMTAYENSKINSLVPDAPFAQRFQEKGSTIRIQTVTLDDFCREQEVGAIDVLKVDTEGFELQVLEGSRSMLQAGAVRFVFAEFNDLCSGDGRTAGSLLPLAQLMRPYGYRFVASYNDYISTGGAMFSVSNALFALPPAGSSA